MSSPPPGWEPPAGTLAERVLSRVARELARMCAWAYFAGTIFPHALAQASETSGGFPPPEQQASDFAARAADVLLSQLDRRFRR